MPIRYSDSFFSHFDDESRTLNDDSINRIIDGDEKTPVNAVGTKLQGYEALANLIIERDDHGVITLAGFYGIDLTDANQRRIAVRFAQRERTSRQIYRTRRS
ncbi:MAG: hypothetical protein H6799_01815 [Candidatus Nomurabacteria bacterium]|nr:MAG: hypothetical protein H6799_01815 [Candidatus Nomurabacteria bacterium]HRV75882.1 hypothetical protein [Candidatus Saccharimonadales bacterium]